MTKLAYRIVIEPLSKDDSGGYFATVPDLPGCMSDGKTPEDALLNVQDAIRCWIEAVTEMGRDIPLPTRTLAAAE